MKKWKIIILMKQYTYYIKPLEDFLKNLGITYILLTFILKRSNMIWLKIIIN